MPSLQKHICSWSLKLSIGLVLIAHTNAEADAPPISHGCELKGPAACEPLNRASDEERSQKSRTLMLREQALFERIKNEHLSCSQAASFMKAEGRPELAERFSTKCFQ